MIVWNLNSFSRVVCYSLLLSGLASCGYDQYITEPSAHKPIAKTSAPSAKLQKAAIQGTEDQSLYYRDLSYRMVRVQPGDTLSKIAVRHEVPTKSVIALNNSAPPYVIHIGQQVKVPYFRHHNVRAGENLYAISRVYEVEMGELVHFNFLETPYRLAPGMVLKIPQKGGSSVQVASTSAKVFAVSRPSQTLATEQIVLQSPPVIRTNRNLKSEALSRPASKVKPAAKPVIIQSVPVALAPTPTEAPAIATDPVELVGDVIAIADLPPVPRSRYSIKQPPHRDGKAFYWPVKGELLSGYGKKKNGLHNDGINIKVIPGTLVKAAENGIVSYVGNEMRSFGNLILISHADGYVTTYGHNAQILVQKGDVVRKGDVIARAGATGDVQVAQLHFEIRKEGTAVDPSRLLDRN